VYEEQGDKLAEEADEESRFGASSAFGFYLVLGLFAALVVAGVFWLLASLNRGSVTILGPGIFGFA